MQIPPASADATSAPLIRDALANQAAYQFRSTRIAGSLPTRFDGAGFAGLGMSGSSQFSEFGWQEIRKHLAGVPDDEIFVLDFREESHGFLNGNAVSWYAAHNWGNAGLSATEAVAFEELRLSTLRKSDTVEVLVGHEVRDRKALLPPVTGTDGALESAPPAPLPLPADFYCAIQVAESACPSQNGRISKKAQIDRKPVECWKMDRVASEREVVGLPAGHYLRFPVTDHLRPSDEMVNAFVAFVRRLPARSHLHFHCHGGDGRTTTFMTMYDMLRNAKNVAFDDIVGRNRIFSTYCLCRIQTDFHRPYAVERWEFVERFYEYAKALTSDAPGRFASP